MPIDTNISYYLRYLKMTSPYIANNIMDICRPQTLHNMGLFSQTSFLQVLHIPSLRKDIRQLYKYIIPHFPSTWATEKFTPLQEPETELEMDSPALGPEADFPVDDDDDVRVEVNAGGEDDEMWEGPDEVPLESVLEDVPSDGPGSPQYEHVEVEVKKPSDPSNFETLPYNPDSVEISDHSVNSPDGNSQPNLTAIQKRIAFLKNL